MPAGVPWPQYLRFFSAAMLTMFAGAQCVHLVYRPLEDMDTWVEREKQKLVHHAAVSEGDTATKSPKSS